MRAPSPYQLATTTGVQAVAASAMRASQGRQAAALHARATALARAARRGRFVEGGVQAQPGDDGDRVAQAGAAGQQRDGRVAAIGDDDEQTLREPAAQEQQRLPRPIGQLLVATAARAVVPLGRGEDGQERQGPGPPRPRDRHEEHQAEPAQPAHLHEVALAGSDRVAVQPLGRDPRPPAPLDGLIEAEDERPSRGERGDQQPEQHAGNREARPLRPAEDAVIGRPAPGPTQPHRPQGATDGALAGGEDRTGDQHQRVPPDPATEQWREREQ